MALYENVVKELRNVFNSKKTLPLKFRLQQLKAFKVMLKENEDVFCSALASDLKKSRHEGILCETDILKNEVQHTLNNLEKWMAPNYVSKTLVTVMDKSYILSQPYGVALILGAWNYPIQLALLPLVGAIAAGNVVILKPSEMAPASSKLLTEIVPRYLDNECYKVIPGAIPESTALLQQRFDIIFYTGGGYVGKIVGEAANKFLTPVVLELGGKSPTYIDSECNIPVAVKRLLWGKFLNAGQTCVAPDYLLCQETVYSDVIASCKKVIKEFFGDNPEKSSDLCRIINDRQFQRVKKLLDSGNIVIGGDTDEKQLYISPTIITDVEENDDIMKDEIFGPVLPIMKVKNEDEAIDFINKRERPLALYVLSTNSKVIDKFTKETTSGSVCCNDTMVFMGVPYLPFGGVGSSGMGRYHGKFSFDQFSHTKTVLIRNYMALGEKLAEGRYPPYSDSRLNNIRFLLTERQFPSTRYLPYCLFFVLGFVSVLVLKAIAKCAGEDLPFPF